MAVADKHQAAVTRVGDREWNHPGIIPTLDRNDTSHSHRTCPDIPHTRALGEHLWEGGWAFR